MRDMDRDGDGKVTRDEFIAACTNNAGIARAFESALERLIEGACLTRDGTARRRHLSNVTRVKV